MHRTNGGKNGGCRIIGAKEVGINEDEILPSVRV